MITCRHLATFRHFYFGQRRPGGAVAHLPYRFDTLEGGPARVKIAKQGTG